MADAWHYCVAKLNQCATTGHWEKAAIHWVLYAGQHMICWQSRRAASFQHPQNISSTPPVTLSLPFLQLGVIRTLGKPLHACANRQPQQVYSAPSQSIQCILCLLQSQDTWLTE
jgi:hypothetical protein